MTWWHWALATLFTSCFVFALRRQWRDHRVYMAQLKKQREKFAWVQACEERQILEDALKRAPFTPLIVPYESSWDYTRRCADMGCIKLKPWQPSWHYTRLLQDIELPVHATISIKLWVTEVDGLFHRVGKLPLEGQEPTPVFLCNPTVRVETEVIEYDRDWCPLINCIMCIAADLHTR